MGITYEIIKENCDNCQCIVIPIAYTNPLEDIDTLISKLSQEDIHSGNIIFDLLCLQEIQTKDMQRFHMIMVLLMDHLNIYRLHLTILLGRSVLNIY